MKKPSILAFLIIAVIFLFCQCKKYPEGNNFSIYTAKQRVITHEWRMTSSLLSDSLFNYSGPLKYSGWAGKDITKIRTSSIDYDFQKNGTFTFRVQIYYEPSIWGLGQRNGTGHWEFGDRKRKIKLNYDAWQKNGNNTNESPFSTNTQDEFKIIQLRMKSMEWDYNKDGSTHHMKFAHC
jgi:hypothetical protein